MTIAKEEVRKILDSLPDTATFEDIQYHIYVREKIEKGIEALQQVQVLTSQETEQRLNKWIGK